ncbi:MAG: hypothetical protein HGA37_15905 [Lentimicrobium sp.]|jgi:hypothetical protein|nr:hypothetical protein [Lentimicrobium sp.]
MTVGYLKRKLSRISQGDIYKDVEFLEYATQDNGVFAISKIYFPYVVVLTQDCDLQWDSEVGVSLKNQDKKLISVIVAPLYNFEHFKVGEHLSELGMKMQCIQGNSLINAIQNNNNPRYHYIEFGGVNIVDSVIDFKHYFTVNVEYLKKHRKSNYVCQVSPLFREQLNLRFANFLSRIGLPEKK